MEYYRMTQDPALRRVPTLKGVFQTVDKKNITPEGAQKLPSTLFFHVDGVVDAVYPDIMDHDLYLISPPLFETLRMYEPELPSILIALTDKKHGEHKNYIMPIWEHIDCLSAKTIFNMDKSVIKRMVLSRDKIDNYRLFRVKHGISQIVIARLDVVESILRRDYLGVKFEEIEIDEEKHA